jgi:hypothetical protein
MIKHAPQSAPRQLLQSLVDQLPFAVPGLPKTPEDTLSTLFTRQAGKPSAKWQGYLQHYDRHLASRKHQALRLLEIGVQAGGSLEIWAQYFKHATHIIGCDIDPACGALRYDDSRINVLVGDINTTNTLQSLSTLTETLDVVIDDGSHHSNDIIRSFVQLFPRMAEGGVYLIEDLHCSYWESYGGGLYDPFSAISFFKKIVDITNRSVWGVDIPAEDFFKEFASIIQTDANAQNWDFLADIHAIEFSNSMCVIHKRAVSKNLLGPLILSGTPTADGQSAYQYVAAEMTVPEQTRNALSQQVDDSQQQGHQQLLLAREEIAKLLLDNTALTTKVYETTKQFYDASVTIQQLEYKLSQLEPSIKPDASESV